MHIVGKRTEAANYVELAEFAGSARLAEWTDLAVRLAELAGFAGAGLAGCVELAEFAGAGVPKLAELGKFAGTGAASCFELAEFTDAGVARLAELARFAGTLAELAEFVTRLSGAAGCIVQGEFAGTRAVIAELAMVEVAHRVLVQRRRHCVKTV